MKHYIEKGRSAALLSPPVRGAWIETSNASSNS